MTGKVKGTINLNLAEAHPKAKVTEMNVQNTQNQQNLLFQKCF
jgi:hypothetical protein